MGNPFLSGTLMFLAAVCFLVAVSLVIAVAVAGTGSLLAALITAAVGYACYWGSQEVMKNA